MATFDYYENIKINYYVFNVLILKRKIKLKHEYLLSSSFRAV